MPIITMPDGQQVAFPNDVPPQIINQAIQHSLQRMQSAQGGPSPPPAAGGVLSPTPIREQPLLAPQGGAGGPSTGGSVSPPTTSQSYPGGLADAFTTGLTVGMGPKVTAAEAALLGRTPEGTGPFDYGRPFAERYQRALAAEQDQQRQFGADHPVGSTAAHIAGVIPAVAAASRVGINPGQAIPRALQSAPGLLGLGGRTAAAAMEGAGIGAGYAAGQDEPIAPGAAVGALTGGGTNLALEPLQRALGSAMRRRQVVSAARTADQMRGETTALYNAFRNSGIVLKPGAAARFARDYRQALGDQSLSRRWAPEAHAIYDDLVGTINSGDPVSLEWIENMRKVLGRASMNMANPNSAHAARVGKELIDQLYDRLSDADVLNQAGAAGSAKAAITAAREAYKRQLKADLLEEVFSKAAGGYQSGEPNGIRIGLRKILREAGARRSKTSRLWTQDELEAIRAAADGGPIDAMVHQLGKMGFAAAGAGSNALGGTFGAGMFGTAGAAVGSALGGPPGAALGSVAGAGMGSLAATGLRRLSDARIKQRANLARDLVNGAQVGIAPPGTTQRAVTSRQLARLLRRMAATAQSAQFDPSGPQPIP